MRWDTCYPEPFDGSYDYFTRDCGLVTRGLQSIRVESSSIIVGVPLPTDEPDLIRVNYARLTSSVWWKQRNLDGVLLYSWGLPKYNDIAKAIREAGIFLILHQDSSGILFPIVCVKGGYHLKKTYCFIEHEKFKALLLLVTWIIYRCTFGFLKLEFGRIKHLSYGNLITCVSPIAVTRYRNYVRRMKHKVLCKRVALLPHPVANYFRYSKGSKTNMRVIAVGRWDDLPQKRAQILIEVINRCLHANHEIVFDILGKITQTMHDWHASLKEQKASRVQLHGTIPNSQLLSYYQRSSILLCTSSHESFHIAAAEALCCGNTVVAPKLDALPSFVWFTENGSGRLSNDETAISIANSLLDEMNDWLAGNRDAKSISDYWCSKLHTNEVANQIVELYKKHS
jgi:glycosyltransferase involved in cell wall biosynthesis